MLTNEEIKKALEKGEVDLPPFPPKKPKVVTGGLLPGNPPPYEDWPPGYYPELVTDKLGAIKGYAWRARPDYEPPVVKPPRPQIPRLPSAAQPGASEEEFEYTPGWFGRAKASIAPTEGEIYKYGGGEGRWRWDDKVNNYVWDWLIEPTKEPTPDEKAGLRASAELKIAEADQIRASIERDKEKAARDQARFAWEQEESAKAAKRQAEIDAFNKEQGMWERGFQEQQVKAQREGTLAGLAAQPMSWLRYAAETKETPVVQPWMPALYPGKPGFGVGQPVPGVERVSTPQEKGEPLTSMSFKNIPEPLRPSETLRAQMGPDALQQYQGLQQARTGQTPENIMWRLRQTAPPAGKGRLIGWGR